MILKIAPGELAIHSFSKTRIDRPEEESHRGTVVSSLSEANAMPSGQDPRGFGIGIRTIQGYSTHLSVTAAGGARGFAFAVALLAIHNQLPLAVGACVVPLEWISA